jgi:hypothetical protein
LCESIGKSCEVNKRIISELLGFEVFREWMIRERKCSWIEDKFWLRERFGHFLFSLIEFCKNIFIRLDRDISAIESLLDIRFQCIQRIPGLELALQGKDIEFFPRTDLLLSLFEILLLLFYDDRLTISRLTDAFPGLIIGSGVFSWHRESIGKSSNFSNFKSL